MRAPATDVIAVVPSVTVVAFTTVPVVMIGSAKRDVAMVAVPEQVAELTV
jgi:hypothetical protein